MPALISKYATRLLNLRVDEIEIRAHATEGGGQQAVRLMASSMSGQWLKADGYLEFIDPTTGETQSYCTVAAKGSDEQMCYLEPYAASTTLTNKRSIARRIGTTYASNPITPTLTLTPSPGPDPKPYLTLNPT